MNNPSKSFNLFCVGKGPHGIQDSNALLLDLVIFRALAQYVQNFIILRMGPRNIINS